MTDAHRNTSASPGREIEVLASGWPPLTAALKLKDCPLKPWLAERFPTKNTKVVFQRYKDTVGPIRVPASVEPTGGGSGAVGGSFDYLVRFLVELRPDVYLPAVGARRYGGRMPAALVELAAALGTRKPSPGELDAHLPPVTTFMGPQQPIPRDPELLARGCWALSLLTELVRAVPPQASPLAELNPRTVCGEDLLALASPVALDQLAALRAQAETVLLPALASRRGTWAVGPVFSGSVLMNADADLIAAGTLVEVKTVLGGKRTDGSRYATLDAQTLFQTLGYVLLDFHDEFGMSEIMLFNARYGHVATWPVQELLDTLTGHPVNLPALRAEFERFLRDGARTAIQARALPRR